MNHLRTVAVIGAGVAGLAAAGLLSRGGLRVTVVEARDKVGGSCGTTEAGGYTFDDGALYLAFPTILDRVFQRLGRDRASLLPLRRISALQTTSLPDGTVVTVRRDRPVRVEGHAAAERSMEAEAGVDRLLARWEPVFRLFADDILVHRWSAWRLVRGGWHHLHKLRGTVASELTELFPDVAVRSAMAGALLYTGTPPQRTPAPAMLGLVAMLSDGFYLPEGGMGKIPEVLKGVVEDGGGEVVLGSKVRRILIKNGRAGGVETDTHGIVEADAVLSTLHGAVTYASLLSAGEASERMRRQARDAPLSHKALALQLGLSNSLHGVSHMESVLPWMDDQGELFGRRPNRGRWLNYAVPTATMPELAPPGGSIIEAYPSIPQDLPIDAWDEGERRKVVDRTIEALALRHPMEIETMRVISPREFRDDLHLYRAAVYGLSPAAGPRTQFPHRTPIPGLYQAGQTTFPGFGVASAAMSGILAAQLLTAEFGEAYRPYTH